MEVTETLQDMLEEIRQESLARMAENDAEWIVDTYNHLFGTNINIEDY